MNKMKNGANDKDIEEGSIEKIGKERILRKDKKKRIEDCQEKTRQTI